MVDLGALLGELVPVVNQSSELSEVTVENLDLNGQTPKLSGALDGPHVASDDTTRPPPRQTVCGLQGW
jgi:hypothetical protein